MYEMDPLLATCDYQMKTEEKIILTILRYQTGQVALTFGNLLGVHLSTLKQKLDSDKGGKAPDVGMVEVSKLLSLRDRYRKTWLRVQQVVQ